MSWWVADLWRTDPAMLISHVVWVIGAIILHELAHGWAALRLGDTTPRDAGHMTWNPLVHMGAMSLIMFALIGFAWGAMPVNESRLRGRRAPAVVAAAGPSMNITLAIASTIALAFWESYAGGVSQPLRDNFETFFLAGIYLNALLAILNMLPLPPLDGWRIVGTFVPAFRRATSHPNAIFFSLFVLYFGFTFIADPVIDVVALIAFTVKDAIIRVLP